MRKQKKNFMKAINRRLSNTRFLSGSPFTINGTKRENGRE
jgi:hypothetical protein